jgi:anti-sigma regulatory factor (Ser/Thr protein kinase)
LVSWVGVPLVSAAHHVEQRLTAEPSSVRAARRVVCDVVGQALPPPALDDVLLATSEVVTNALEHGGPPVELCVDCDSSHIRVEVRDGSPLPPRVRDEVPSPAEVRGRGMVIVDRCTDRWGIDPLADGKKVWFERRLAGQRFPNASTPPR